MAEVNGGEGLPVVYRLAVLYLLLPVAVWLLGWFEWWFGIPAVAFLGAGLWRVLAGRWWERVGPAAFALPLFALICGVLPAFVVFGADHPDSMAHRAVLLALAHSDWPAYLTDYLNDEPPLLRYYLGYHIVPGLVGKWLGIDALNWAVALWTWGGIALVMALCAQGLPTLRAMLLPAAVFVFFCGMDVLEHVLRDGLPDAARHFAEQFGVASMPEPADPMFCRTTRWPPPCVHLEYSAFLGITPHHFIGGGLTTLLMLRLCGEPRFQAASGIVLAACLFWSSLLCVGLLPLVGAMLVKNGIRPFLGWRNMLLAPALAALLALYLTSGQVDFPSSWLWALYASGFQLAADVALFYLVQFLALALVLWWLHPRLGREPFFVAAVAMLLAAPWFWYGGPGFNEFSARAAIPPRCVLAYYAARAAAERLPEVQLAALGSAAGTGGRGRWLAADVSKRVVFALLIAVLGIGAVSTLVQFARQPSWLRFVPIGRISPVLLVDLRPVVVAQRTARDVPGALQALLRGERRQSGDKGELLIRSTYDVYRDGNWLIYANRYCDGAAEALRRFRLRVHREEAAGARRPFGATNLDFFLGYRFANAPYDGRGGCVVRARLPDHGIARIHTGQHEADGAVVWEAGYDFETKEQFSSPDFYLPEYQAVVAGAPAARSDFDVYLGDGQLAIFKAPCKGSDTEARFLVHLYAQESGDLPGGRQQYGFENLDFDFSEKGVAWDAKCLATIQLPDYAVDRVSVGQFLRAEGRYRDLWRVDFPTSGSADVADDADRVEDARR